ncbi:MAG: LamG-like jellyroll fold domain-containing protein [bacterium]
MNKINKILLLVLSAVWLVPVLSFAQLCEPIYSVERVHVTNTTTGQVQSNQYNMIVTVGQPAVVVNATNYSKNSIATGFWSHYLKEPAAPLVRASDGDFQDMVLLEWDIEGDRTGPPVTSSEVTLYRNGYVLTTLPVQQTQYQDFNLFSGMYYTYGVTVENDMGKSHTDDDIGFLNPNGMITGHVQTPSGNPVLNTKVILTPNLGRSVKFNGDGYIYWFDGDINTNRQFSGLEGDYTIETWIRSVHKREQVFFAAVDSAGTDHYITLELTEDGKVKWTHNSVAGGSGSEIVTVNSYAGAGENWHHLAVVYADSIKSMTMYIDGFLVGEATAGGSISDRVEIILGKRGPREPMDYFEGRLDDFRIWSVAREWDDLRNMMDITLSGEEDGLVVYWKFDEVEGETVFDLTDSDLDGSTCGVERDNYLAPVYLGALTDEVGNYAIKGIYYADGKVFRVTPSMASPIGRSLEFDGIDDYIRFEGQRIDLTTGYTLEGWFKTASNSNNTIFTAVNPSDDSHRLSVELTAGKVKAAHFDAEIITSDTWNDNLWHHYAVTNDNATMKLYVDGELKGTAVVTGSIPDPSEIVIARMSPEQSSGYFKGRLDEIRLWKYMRTEEQVGGTMNQVLEGDEYGLTNYWRMNDGTDSLVTDAASIVTGTITGADSVALKNMWNQDIPLNEYFDHWYEPESRNAALNNSNTAVNNVDFIDQSMIPVSGYVRYMSTACFQEGVLILLNGESLIPPIYTDSDGKYILDIEPGSIGDIISCVYEDHEFVPPLIELPMVVSPMTGLFFNDRTTHKVNGYVAGGSCKYPITPSQGQIEVTFSSVGGCIEETVVPDEATGMYESPNLPPLIYIVTINHPDPAIDDYFTGDTLSLKDSDREMEFIYHASPEVEFVNLPPSEVECSQFPLVLKQRRAYQAVFQMYESYGENRCPVGSFDLEVFDNISDTTYSTHLDLEDTDPFARISFTGNKVNLLAGGDHPYQRNIQIVVKDTLGRSASTELWAFIEGDEKVPGVNFSTTTSKMPWWVLRVPPGDGSSTYMTTDQTICKGTRFSNTHTTAQEFNNTVHAGAEITTFVGGWAGFGGGAVAGLIMTTEFIMDIGANFAFNQTWTDINETCECLTTSQTYATSGDGLITGDDATVFIGGGYTMDMGIARYLSLDENCQVVIDTVLTVKPSGVSSTYIHSKYYIKNVLMPDLWMQYTVDDDEDALKDYNYWQEILDKDSIAIATAVSSELLEIGEEGQESSNISFDAGAELEYSYSREHTSSDVSTTIFEDMQQLYLEQGFECFGIGFSLNQAFTHTHTSEKTVSTDETKTQTVGFILNDDDPGDGFAFAVKQDLLWDMPVFDLIGGQSSCPWEAGTMKRQMADISSTPSLQEDVPPDEPAVFMLLLGNSSGTGEDNYYNLSFSAETNPGSAVLSSSGGNLVSGIDYFIVAGQVVEIPLYVTRGPEEYNYDNIVLQLAPPCENEIGFELSANPQNSDWVEISVHFQEPCSESNIASPEDGWLITSVDEQDTLWVTVDGYNWPADTFMTGIVLQYRSAGGGDWFTIYSVPKDSLVDNYVLMPFNISPDIIIDGEYELRSRAMCTGDKYPGTSQVVTGTIDRTAPQVLGLPEPVDGILGPDDLIRVTFNEGVACGEISPGAGDIMLFNTVTGNPMDYTFTCGGNVITFEPNVQNMFIENQIFRAEIHNLQDVYGNTRDEAVVWEFFVNRNPLAWSGTNIDNVVLYVDEEYSTMRQLVNNGGSNRSWEIIGGREGAIPSGNPLDLPSWLDVNPLEGILTPGASQDISIALTEDLNFGEYNTIIYAAGTMGDEPLTVDIRKLCYPPVWEFTPNIYQYSMTITATLSTDGELSADTYDIIAAFVDGEIRSITGVEHIPEFEEIPNTHPYEVFLTVYSNDISGEELSFRVWDASECMELGMIEEFYSFEANLAHGTPTSPVTITATSQIISQMPFFKGWNWFSLNLENSDMSVNSILQFLEPANGDLIKSQTQFDQFVPNYGWVGTLDTLDNSSMYLIKLARADTLEMIGYAVDVEKDTIRIVKGWNWIGYTPQKSYEINRALESLEAAATGDLIKSQYRYSQFVEQIGWLGSLRYMDPKLGYRLSSYYPGELLYPYYDVPVLAKSSSDSLIVEEMENPTEWTVDPTEYQFNMTVTGIVEVNGSELDSCTDVIAAFVGKECRGVAMPQYIPQLDQSMVFMMIYSNQAENERIEFKFYDASEDIELYVENSYIFEADKIVGSVEEPEIFVARVLRIGDPGYIPEEFSLNQNYPNPFNPVTTIAFGLPEESDVLIDIYNIMGQKVKTLLSEKRQPGYYFVQWDGKNDRGQIMPTSMYIYRMRAGSYQQIKKMVLLK